MWPPLQPEKYEDLCGYPRARVEDNVMHRACARWDEALMPFIKAGHECSSKNRDARPAHGPLQIQVFRDGQRGAPRPEEQNAQNTVANDMACLAHVEVPMYEVSPVHSEKEVQQRVQNPAGIV